MSIYSNFEALRLSVYKCKFKIIHFYISNNSCNRVLGLSMSIQCKSKLGYTSSNINRYWHVHGSRTGICNWVSKQTACQTRSIRSRTRNGLDFVSSLKQPYRSLLIFLVGKSHCAEAVESLKEMAYCLSRLLIRQCKFHTGQKFQRCLQTYSFYSRMWGDEMTCKMISGIQKSLLRSGKCFLLSAMLMLPYDWDKYRIPDDKMKSSVEELNTVDDLCFATVCCEDCRKRQVIDKMIHNVDYCKCKGKTGYVDKSRQFDSWEPFLERENILVWRRKHNVQSHLFSYKVYGTYDDMSLSAFMEVQLNPSFRTQWDSTALELKIIDSQHHSNSDLLYWLVKFPHFFANRDYVFKRRYHVDEERKQVIIVNEIADHAQLPTFPGVHRVKDYWSIMVLRSKNGFNQPGMSYTLTYFDNPGTSLPSAVTNFVASTAFPDFLKQVHKAAMSLQRRWENGEDVYISLPQRLRYSEISDLTGLHSENEYSDSKSDVLSKEIVGQEQVETDITTTSLDGIGSKKLSQFRIIKEAIINSKEVQHKSEANVKIPLKFRKVIIDLLEAIEVVPPDLENKTALATKIESLVDKLGLDKASKSNLLLKLKNFKLKTKTLINDASKKKEESYKIMNDFERRKPLYDHSVPDDPTLLHVKGFFRAISEVLRANNDMRTGKGFKKATEFENVIDSSGDGKPSVDSLVDEKPSATVVINEIILPEKNGLESQLNSLLTVCACCECDNILQENQKESVSWYNFSYIVSWMWTVSSSAKSSSSEDFCKSCVCEHKEKKGKTVSLNMLNTKPMGENVETNNFEGNLVKQSNWFFFSSVISNEDISLTSEGTHFKTESKASLGEITENEVESNVPWYWLPVSGSLNFISWIYSYWTKQSV